MLNSPSEDFWNGFLVGAVITAVILVVINWIYGLLMDYVRRMLAADKPQTVVHETDRTPQDVVDDAKRANRQFWMLLGAIYVLSVLVLELLRPGTLLDVVSLARRAIERFW